MSRISLCRTHHCLLNYLADVLGNFMIIVPQDVILPPYFSVYYYQQYADTDHANYCGDRYSYQSSEILCGDKYSKNIID
jgi:hypothetical protein